MGNKRQKNQRFFSYAFFPKNHKGMSGLIVTVIMIALSIIVVAIVWGVINNLVKEEIGKSSSCFGILDKVSIENRYTCFDSNDNTTRFQLSIGDISVDEVLVSISGEGGTKSFTLTNEYQDINDLVNYSGGGSKTKLPEKNGGITYKFSWGSDPIPDLIRVAPVINGKQCDASDTLAGIVNCSLLI